MVNSIAPFAVGVVIGVVVNFTLIGNRSWAFGIKFYTVIILKINVELEREDQVEGKERERTVSERAVVAR